MPTISTDLDAQIKAMLAQQKGQAPQPAPAAPAPSPAPAPEPPPAPKAAPAPAPPKGVPDDFLPPARGTSGPLRGSAPPAPATPELPRRTAYLTPQERVRMANDNVEAQQAAFNYSQSYGVGWPNERARQQEQADMKARLIGARESRSQAEVMSDRDRRASAFGGLARMAANKRALYRENFDGAYGSGAFDAKVNDLQSRYEALRGGATGDERSVRTGIVQDMQALGFTPEDMINQGIDANDLVRAGLVEVDEKQTAADYAAAAKQSAADETQRAHIAKRMRQDLAAGQAYQDVMAQYPDDDLQRLQAAQNRDKARRELLFEQSVMATGQEFTYLDRALDMLEGRIQNRRFALQEAVMRELPEAPLVQRAGPVETFWDYMERNSTPPQRLPGGARLVGAAPPSQK